MRIPLTPAELGFEAIDRRQLSRAMIQAVEARSLRRFQAVLFVAEGRSFAEAAHLSGLSMRFGLPFGDRLPALPLGRGAA